MKDNMLPKVIYMTDGGLNANENGECFDYRMRWFDTRKSSAYFLIANTLCRPICCGVINVSEGTICYNELETDLWTEVTVGICGSTGYKESYDVSFSDCMLKLKETFGFEYFVADSVGLNTNLEECSDRVAIGKYEKSFIYQHNPIFKMLFEKSITNTTAVQHYALAPYYGDFESRDFNEPKNRVELLMHIANNKPDKRFDMSITETSGIAVGGRNNVLSITKYFVNGRTPEVLLEMTGKINAETISLYFDCHLVNAKFKFSEGFDMTTFTAYEAIYEFGHYEEDSVEEDFYPYYYS